MTKVATIQKIRNFISNTPEYLVYAGAFLLIIDDFLKNFTSLDLLHNDQVRLSVATFIILLFVVYTSRRLEDISGRLDAISKNTENEMTTVLPGEKPELSDLISKNIQIDILTLSGTKTIPLGDDKFVRMVNDTSRKSKLRIVLGDPHSDAVKLRYQNDEPPTFEAGVEGIARRLFQLQKLFDELPSELKHKTDIRVFSGYPTLSVWRIGEELFYTNYGYQLRGSDCPICKTDTASSYGRFLTSHFDKVFDSSIPISQWKLEGAP